MLEPKVYIGDKRAQACTTATCPTLAFAEPSAVRVHHPHGLRAARGVRERQLRVPPRLQRPELRLSRPGAALRPHARGRVAAVAARVGRQRQHHLLVGLHGGV